LQQFTIQRSKLRLSCVTMGDFTFGSVCGLDQTSVLKSDSALRSAKKWSHF